MKKGVFICNPKDEKVVFDHPWKTSQRVYNSKELHLTPGNGLPAFKKSFSAKKEIKSAKLYVTALGIFEAYINGVRVGNNKNGTAVFDELKPEWTDYRFRVFEYKYDVKNLLNKNNTMVACVANGYFSGRISFGTYGYKKSAFCAELVITYKNGEKEIIATDESWKTSICGPVLFSDIYDGEYFDARIAHPALNDNDIKWNKAKIFTEFEGKIEPHQGEYVRVREELAHIPMSAVVHNGTVDNGTKYGEIKVVSKRLGKGCEQIVLKKGESIILDMGQNIVGRPKICISGASGTRIEGYFAEFLNDSGDEGRGNDGSKGSLYLRNYRSALSRIMYIAKGETKEEYVPLYCYFGFRYFELCADSDIEIHYVTGEIIGTELREVGTITTSNAEVNKLISNVLWGQRGNYVSVPTDCPQRDERLGWTGDTQIFCGAASYNAYIKDFMHKWLRDARDSQSDTDGAYTNVIPAIKTGGKAGNAAWADAGLIVPYRLWLMYNDTEIISEHYDSMENYMKYLEQFGMQGPNTAYGDWLNYEVTDKRYIAVCYYAHDAYLMEFFSSLLGKTERAEYYHALGEKIKAYYLQTYTDSNEVLQKTQTGYLLALRFNLLPEDMRKRTIKQLEQKIIENDYTLSTGFVGTGILNQTLSDLDLDELCYSLLLQTKDPSWLYSVRQGATTIWERWNSYTLEKGFGNYSMNSYNHYAYGAVVEWIYARMIGISPDEENPGFRHFVLCPRPDTRSGNSLPQGQTNITSASGSYISCCGKISAGWAFENGVFKYDFTIPCGTSARVEFPLINGRDFVNINGIDFTPPELGGKIIDNKLIFDLSEGEYSVK